ncbi:MAG: PadR family transcriptional regulator [Gemmatimonadales bacterium]
MRDFLAGAVRLHVLHHASQGQVHGSWLMAELARHGHKLSPGTLYPLLHRMEQAGLLASRVEVGGGHRRRFYQATDAGRSALASCRQALAELAAELLPGGQAGQRVASRTGAGGRR